MKSIESRLGVLLFAAVVFLGACSLTNSGAPDDKTITADIEAKFFHDPQLKTRDIHVESQKGVVTLTGTVATDLEKSGVERIASQEKGVKQVINQLTFLAPDGGMAASAPQAAAIPSQAGGRETVPRKHASRHKTRRHTAPASEFASAAPQDSAPPAPPQPAPVVQQTPARPQPPPPLQVTVPAGSVVTVRMIDAIDSSRNSPGQEFAASVDSPVAVGDRVVIPRGSDAKVRLVEASTSGRMRGSSSLQVELVSIGANGTTYNVRSGYHSAQGASRGKRTAETIGGGAALGAIIGAIAGGRRGAAIGAGVGGGGGAGVEASSRGAQVKIPSEAKIDFTLKAPINMAIRQQAAE